MTASDTSIMTASDAVFDYVYLRTSSEQPEELRPLENDPTEFISERILEVIGVDFQTGLAGCVGTVQSIRVLCTAAFDQGFGYQEVLVNQGDELYDVGRTLYEAEGVPWQVLAQDFDSMHGGADIVYLHSGDFLDKPWGPHVLHTLMQHANGAQYVVVAVEGLVEPKTDLDAVFGLLHADILTEMGFFCPVQPRTTDRTHFYFDLHSMPPMLPEHLTLGYAARRLRAKKD